MSSLIHTIIVGFIAMQLAKIIINFLNSLNRKPTQREQLEKVAEEIRKIGDRYKNLSEEEKERLFKE